jgi:uncharacterized membrane protein YiaA
MHRPTGAFIGASWAALAAGMISYIVGLWNAKMDLSEKGFYFVLLLFGLFAVVSLQKSVRDQLEGIPVTSIYYGLSWIAVSACFVTLTVGLWNADLVRSEKGFYAMAYALGLFGAVTVQKNIRDTAAFDNQRRPAAPARPAAPVPPAAPRP